ncbi:MAG: 4Fe-4S binding protein [Bacillota bacterium]
MGVLTGCSDRACLGVDLPAGVEPLVPCRPEGLARVRSLLEQGQAVVVLSCGRELAEREGFPAGLACVDVREIAWLAPDEASLRRRLDAALTAAQRRAAALGWHPAVPRRFPAERKVLVLGAGVAGREASRALAALGCPVLLVEGGPGPVTGLGASVEVAVSTTLAGLTGHAGAFTARLAGAVSGEVSCGAVIVATGCRWELRSDCYGGLCPGAGIATVAGPFAAADVPAKVTFWLDAAPGEGRWCFEPALRTAVSMAGAGSSVYILHREARVAGDGLEALYAEARRRGVTFVKYDRVAPAAGRLVAVEAGSGRELAAPEGLIVLGLSAAPAADAPAIAGALDLDTGPDGYLQADSVHAEPVLTRRRGIYVAGSCRGPMTEAEAIRDARAAAMGAGALIAGGEIGRTWPVAVVDPDKCALCLTCQRACPHRAIVVDSVARAASAVPQACYGCGVCAGECPAKAIQVEGYADAAMLAEIGEVGR